MTANPVVGIVTRTKNRVVLLKRAIESVLSQTYPDWVMVIVNDGGVPELVDRLLDTYEDRAKGRIKIVHNPRSLGMEGASKVGIEAIESELLVIHDDDDTWASEFLSVCVRQLSIIQAKFPGVQGVTTYSNRVIERIQGNLVHIEAVEAFNPWVPHGFLSLDRMLVGNFIPPISFLFSRQAYNDLGAVYEAIPYLGDWDFLVRFLSRYDVYLIPQYLAFYHWRADSQSDAMGNTVTSEVDTHRMYRQYLMNNWLRQDLAAGRMGIGAYANLRGHIETLIHLPYTVRGVHNGADADEDLHRTFFGTRREVKWLRDRMLEEGDRRLARMLDDWLNYQERRSTLPTQRLKRIPAVMSLLLTGRYHRFGHGIGTAFRDIRKRQPATIDEIGEGVEGASKE